MLPKELQTNAQIVRIATFWRRWGQPKRKALGFVKRTAQKIWEGADRQTFVLETRRAIGRVDFRLEDATSDLPRGDETHSRRESLLTALAISGNLAYTALHFNHSF